MYMKTTTYKKPLPIKTLSVIFNVGTPKHWDQLNPQKRH